MAQDVFISYRSEDRAAAERICAGLERDQISCWLAPRDIAAGQEWATAIVEALRQCKAFVLVLSSNSKNAKQISREAELADQQSLPIITFRIEDVQPPPSLIYFLSNIQWLDAFDGRFDTALERLSKTIQQKAPIKEESAPPPKPQSVPTPILAAPIRLSPTSAKSPPWKLIGAAVLLIVLAVAAWLVFRSSGKKPRPPSEASEAKVVAERFVKERDSGDFDAAWSEYAPAFRDSVNRANWQRSAEKRNAIGVRHHYEGCKADGDGYSCVYTLLYKDGAAETDTLKLVRGDAGQWSIVSGNITGLR